MSREPILTVRDLRVSIPMDEGLLTPVRGVNFALRANETLGLVGESGCGKTTLGRMIVRAIPATSGKVIYTAANGKEYDIQALTDKEMKEIRSEVQMIFQDPYSSLDPRMTVFDIISEPLRANYKDMPKAGMEERVKQIAQKAGLNPSYLKRYPHAFSGGQRQRIGIARALILLPRLIVCNEAVSALDVSVQAQVVNLLRDLQQELGLTYLFISHDLSVIEHISDRVGVMYLGRMVEYAPADALFRGPMHPYSEALLTVHRLSADRRAVSAGSADGQDQCAQRGKRRKDHMKHVIIFTDCGDPLVDESKQDFIDRERCLVRSAGLVEGAREELVDLKEHGFRVAMVAGGLVESFDNIVAQHGLAPPILRPG